jgi:hypothetical protein
MIKFIYVGIELPSYNFSERLIQDLNTDDAKNQLTNRRPDFLSGTAYWSFMLTRVPGEGSCVCPYNQKIYGPPHKSSVDSIR